MEPIGQTLREARERKGVTLQQAREALRIHAAHLDALEAEEFEKLPAPAYARAFLRQYAVYLDLDPEPLIEAYNARNGNQLPSMNVGWSAAPTAESSWGSSATPIIAVGTLVVLLLGGVYGVHAFLAGKEEARRSLEEAEKARKTQTTREVPAPSAGSVVEPPAAANVADKPGTGAASGPAGAMPAAPPAEPDARPAPGASAPSGATGTGNHASGAHPPAKPVAPPPSGAAAQPVSPPASAPAQPAPPAGARRPGTPQPAPGGGNTAAPATPAQDARGGVARDGLSVVAARDDGDDALELARSSVETTLRVKERCWVRVHADGKPIYEGTLRPGTERTWRAEQTIDLVMGNAGGVRLVVNGEELGPAGRPGEVVRRVLRPASATRVAGRPDAP